MDYFFDNTYFRNSQRHREIGKLYYELDKDGNFLGYKVIAHHYVDDKEISKACFPCDVEDLSDFEINRAIRRIK